MKITETENERNLIQGENFSLKFKGLGLSNRGDDFWRCWFPMVKRHNLTLTIENLSEDTPYNTSFPIPTGSLIEIQTNIESQRTADDTFQQQMLDLNDGLLHPNGITLKDNLGDALTRMKFPKEINLFPAGNATLFDVWELVSADEKKRKGDKLIYDEADSSMLCKSGTSTKLIISGKLNVEFSLPNSQDSYYLLTFNNRCEELACATMTDFQHYYSLFDLPVGENKFELLPKPSKAPAPMCDFVNGSKIRFIPF
jgi:hypothetical protein